MRNLSTVSGVPEAADYIGQLNVTAQEKSSTQQNVFEASFIVGGQVGNEQPKIRMVYPEGNRIAFSKNSPFLQIGESKYCKPILDRIMTMDSGLDTAASCALVSMDSTMRSKLSGGPPIEVTIYEKDTFSLEKHYRFDEHSEYVRQLSKSWDAALKDALKTLPPIAWGAP